MIFQTMINRITLLLFIGLAFWSCEEEQPADCAGVAGGSAVLDNCNVCDDDPANDCALIHLTPISQSIMVGESAIVTIEIDELSDPIFSISMEINYQTSILAFDDSSGFVVGDFFGADHIVFITEESSIIYLTITLLQGEELIHGSGSIGNLTFTGLAAGTCNIQIPIDGLHFFDDSGNEIFPNDLFIEHAVITVLPE
jgi:hypothetical protein